MSDFFCVHGGYTEIIRQFYGIYISSVRRRSTVIAKGCTFFHFLVVFCWHHDFFSLPQKKITFNSRSLIFQLSLWHRHFQSANEIVQYLVPIKIRPLFFILKRKIHGWKGQQIYAKKTDMYWKVLQWNSRKILQIFRQYIKCRIFSHKSALLSHRVFLALVCYIVRGIRPGLISEKCK